MRWLSVVFPFLFACASGPTDPVELNTIDNETTLRFPDKTMYVILENSGLTYDNWTKLYTWQNPETDRLSDADPEKDGVNNMLEFAWGSNPLAYDRDILPRINYDREGDNGFFRLDYRKSNLAHNLRFEIEISTNLENWDELSNKQPGVIEEVLDSDINGDGAVSLIRLKAPLAMLDSSTSTFIRLTILELGGT